MKKFYISISALICSLSLITVISCSEQKGAAPESEQLEQNYFSDLYDLVSDVNIEKAANPDNPYDYIGQLHFQGINYILSHSTPQYSSYSAATEEFLATLEINGTKAASAPVQNVLTKEQIDRIVEEAMSLRINTSEKLSPAAQKEIIRLAETIQDLFENPGDYSYERIKTQIMDFEEDIINDYGLMEGDKQIVLQTTSVFRYSTAQWEEALPGFSAEIVPTGWTLNGKKLKWWQWLVVGIADAAGGALGTAIGGPLGTAGGAVLASSGAAGIFVATN